MLFVAKRGSTWLLMACCCATLATSTQCEGTNGGDDGSLSDACNAEAPCDYNARFLYPPLGGDFYYMGYVCAGEVPDRIPEEVMPNEGCVLLIVFNWVDLYYPCVGHCIGTKWLCYHIDTTTDTARIAAQYERQENPFDYERNELLQVGTEVEMAEISKRYILAGGDIIDKYFPANVLTRTLLVIETCDGCGPGKYIPLPLE